MGEKLDRSLQFEILRKLSDNYPRYTDMGSAFNLEDSAISVNTHYLQEHGLLVASWIEDDEEEAIYPTDARISAHGLDFLADDGGLGAILSVLTVKLHDQTIKQLLIDKVESAAGEQGAKQKLIERIKGLPADMVSEIAKRLLDRGIDSLPTSIHALAAMLPF